MTTAGYRANTMPDADRQRWNQRYQRERYDFTPAAWLIALEGSIRPRWPGSRALDLACGGGRHALYLGGLGYTVDAWDISDVGLDFLRTELEQRAVNGLPLPVEPRRVDLERTAFPPAAFDLILDAHYLDRAIFEPLCRALRRGGLLIVHTFLYTPGGPITAGLSNPAYALQPGELERTFGTQLEILALTEDPATEEAHLLARRSALAVSGGQ
jgi:SAM-dependent methyltransferase